MNPTSSESRWSAVVAAVDPSLQNRLAAVLRVVGVRPTSVVSTDQLPVFVKSASVTCVCARVFGTVSPPPPVVVVVRGSVAAHPHHHQPPGEPVWLSAAELGPVRMLGALVRATLVNDTETLRRVFPGIPPILAQAFLCVPRSARTVSGMSRALDASPRRVRAALKDAGSRRMEHFVARLKCLTWEHLVRQGATRWVIEAYLGIDDRSNFRKACNRAQTLVPWRATPATNPLGPCP